MRKICGLKVRFSAACLIDITNYLDTFPGAKSGERIGETELNEMFLNRMSNICIRQAYVQGFDCELITPKKAVNMFERTETV